MDATLMVKTMYRPEPLAALLGSIRRMTQFPSTHPGQISKGPQAVAQLTDAVSATIVPQAVALLICLIGQQLVALLIWIFGFHRLFAHPLWRKSWHRI